MITHPNGTPFPIQNRDNIISISSFNLLAPLYIRPVDTRTGKIQPFASFDWISEEDSDQILGDAIRLPKLLTRLQSCGSDFICVQELQLEKGVRECDSSGIFSKNSRGKRSRKEDCDVGKIDNSSYVLPEWISPLVANNPSMKTGDSTVYSVILPEQSELQKMGERNQRVLQMDAAVTNAIFYRSDKWKSVPSTCSNGSTTNCVMQGFVPIQSESGQNKDNQLSDPIVVVSIHLDARSEEKRVQQLQRCLELCAKSSEKYIPSMIIAGDYNCELFRGSCIYEFLNNASDEHGSSRKSTTAQDMQNECAKALRLPSNFIPTEGQMKSWTDLCRNVSDFVTDNCLILKRINTGTTRVAYNHDDEMADGEIIATTCTAEEVKQREMEQWHLDHIMYTSLTLEMMAKWSTLEDDAYSTRVGLPNIKVPTDHLPIAAAFQLRPHPRLSEEVRARIFSSVKNLEERHAAELETLGSRLDRTRIELEEKHSRKNEGIVDESRKTKKSKKRPPPDIIEHIRNSRAAKKELKEKHKTERNAIIQDLGVLERMELQGYMNGLCCRKWAEIGR